MIQLVEYKNINKQKWDAYIDRSPNACIFVYSWYLDATCENWLALVLNDYEAVFPIATKSKYRINYLYQPFFTRYFGVFSKNKLSDEMLSNFIDAIPSNYKYIDFCLHESNQLNNNQFKIKERKYQVLNLDDSYQALQKKYSDNAKRNIKKAEKKDFIIEHNVKPELIVDLFKSTKGQELEVFSTKEYKTLIDLMKTCVKKDKAVSLAVYSNGTICAAGFFMKSNNRFVFLKSGVTEYGKKNGAMHLLFDTFIKEYASTPQLLDFGGSSVDTVARFYKNFGAKDSVYLQINKNSLPKLVKLFKK